jgi:hypothetical protein
MSNQSLLDDWIASSHGEKGIDYEKAAQITWWSILEGLAVAALAAKIPDILVEVSQNNRWYLLLYVVVSLMVVVNAWVQMAWAILIFRWPISLLYTALILLLGLAAYLSCLYVGTPEYWIRAIGFLVASAIIVDVYNIRNRAMMDLPATITKRTIVSYGMFFLIAIVASIHMTVSPDAGTFTLWGFAFLVLATFSWILQDRNMKEERRIRNVP